MSVLVLFKNEFFLFSGENKTRLTVEIAALRASALTLRRTKSVGTVRQRRPQWHKSPPYSLTVIPRSRRSRPPHTVIPKSRRYRSPHTVIPRKDAQRLDVGISLFYYYPFTRDCHVANAPRNDSAEFAMTTTYCHYEERRADGFL